MTKLQLLADDVIRDDSQEAIPGGMSTSGQLMTTRSIPRTMSSPSINSTKQPDGYNSDSGEISNGSCGIPVDTRARENLSDLQSILSGFSETPMISSTNSTPFSIEQNLFLKLQRRRLHNERIRSSLEEEVQKHILLQKEEEGLRQKISRAHEVIGSLREQSESVEATYKSMEELYRTNTEKLKILQAAARDVQDQLQKDTKQFNLYSSQLKKLHQHLPELTRELAKAADKNTGISQSLIQRAQMSLTSPETRDSIPPANIDICVQTNCDMDTAREIESIRKQLHMQRGAMKQVRETVDLIRRCS